MVDHSVSLPYKCDEIIFIETFSYRYNSFCLKNTIKIDMIKNNAKSFKVYNVHE